MSFFEEGKKYRVRVTDLNSPDAETFSVSLNDLTGRYPINEDIEMPGELINVLLDATVPHEIIERQLGFPKVVGLKLRPRFAVTPVGLVPTPTADATLITPGVSGGSLQEPQPPSDEGAIPFDPYASAAPSPEDDAEDNMTDREAELSAKSKGQLIDIAKDKGLDYTIKNSKSEMITGILAAEASV